MLGRSMRRWNVPAAVIMAIAAAVTLTVGAAPAEAGKKRTIDPDQIVEDLVDRLDDRMRAMEKVSDRAMSGLEKSLERAVDRARLRDVLKADQRAARAMARSLKSFDRSTERDQKKALKLLGRLTTDPDHELAVRMAVADAIAAAQTEHNDLRAEIAEHVNEAIDAIQMLLDADIEGFVP